MKTFAVIFGRKPAISLAEFQAVCRRDQLNTPVVQTFLPVVFWSGTSERQSRKLFEQLGGAIKLVEEIQRCPIKDSIGETIRKSLTPEFLQRENADASRQVKFGLSFYPLRTRNEPFRLIKSLTPHFVALRKALPKSKWITSKESTLSSVIITKEKLLQSGVDVNVFFDDREVILGKTLAVQDFKSFSERDYGRPARNDRSGMLPPKLARIMLNLSELPKDAVLLDPHCGSGTVLQEALLLGFSKVMGSDLAPKAVEDTRRNLEWLGQRHTIPMPHRLTTCDATHLEHCFEKNIDGIVTEPFLGPSRASERRSPERVIAQLSQLYLQTFDAYARVLRSRGVVVSIFPIFATGRQHYHLPVFDQIRKKGFELIDPNLPECFEQTPRHTLIYGRPQQDVLREMTMWRYTEK